MKLTKHNSTKSLSWCCLIVYTFTQLSGTLESPNYPCNYSNNMNATYTITAPTGSAITLTILKFDLENNKDLLQVLQQFHTAVLQISHVA